MPSRAAWWLAAAGLVVNATPLGMANLAGLAILLGDIAGVPVFYTPYLAHPDPTAGAKSGLLLPALGVSRNLGAFYRQPYYIAIADDQDATIAPYLTSSAGKGAQFEYRRDFRSGHFRKAFLTLPALRSLRVA